MDHGDSYFDKLLQGAEVVLLDVDEVETEWADLDQFEQGEFFFGIQDAYRYIGILENAQAAGKLTDAQQEWLARVKRLREHYEPTIKRLEQTEAPR